MSAFMGVNILIVVFWITAIKSLAGVANVADEPAASIFKDLPKDKQSVPHKRLLSTYQTWRHIPGDHYLL
jgi:hypothetical protein